MMDGWLPRVLLDEIARVINRQRYTTRDISTSTAVVETEIIIFELIY